jgi:hypothetical protein
MKVANVSEEDLAMLDAIRIALVFLSLLTAASTVRASLDGQLADQERSDELTAQE